MTDDRVIGINNRLPWKLSEDLKRFKALTMGHPIIMGRKTFDSIGKPLPGRDNIVVTRDQNFNRDGVIVTHSLDEALRVAAEKKTGEEFVIGGAALFEAAFPRAECLYLTRIHKKFDGDVFFPALDLEKSFRVVEQTKHTSAPPDHIPFSFIIARRTYGI